VHTHAVVDGDLVVVRAQSTARVTLEWCKARGLVDVRECGFAETLGAFDCTTCAAVGCSLRSVGTRLDAPADAEDS
jgi:hypothetical protein